MIGAVAACLAAVSAMAASGPLHLAITGEPETLDPHRYNLRIEETVLTDLFLGLTTFDAHGNVVGGCAESWSVSDDALTWRFELRDGLRWSDGVPLTAADFVYAFRRLQEPATAASLAYFMYPVKNAEAVNAGRLPATELGVRAPSPGTLVIELEAPYPHLPERLLYPTAFPVPAHVIERVGERWVKPEHWVSNGAYVLSEWQPQSHLRLDANPRFFQRASVATVIYHPVADERVQLNRFRAGELDAIATFPPGEQTWAERNQTDALRVSPLLSIVYLVFNVTRPPFDDARIRSALAMVVDNRLLTDKVLRTGERPNDSFVPQIVDDYTPQPPPHAGQSMAARLARAVELLDEAGVGPERPVEVEFRYVAGAQAKKVAVAIASFWKPLGVQTRLHHSELKVHFSSLRQNDFQVAQAGWFGENNPEHYLGLLDSTTGNVNYGRYVSAEFDRLMAAARSEGAIPARHALLARAERLALADYPVVPLYSVVVRRLVSPDIGGWYDNPRDAHPARFLYRR